jgi:hypothetical protein
MRERAKARATVRATGSMTPLLRATSTRSTPAAGGGVSRGAHTTARSSTGSARISLVAASTSARVHSAGSRKPRAVRTERSPCHPASRKAASACRPSGSSPARRRCTSTRHAAGAESGFEAVDGWADWVVFIGGGRKPRC